MSESAVATKSSISLDFKDMNDFANEQDAIDKKEGIDRDNLRTIQKVPKLKNILDGETVAVEEAATVEVGTENWIGKLLEYRNVHPVGSADGGIVYSEATQNSQYGARFTCTVEIFESTETFGCSGAYGVSQTVASFSSKKIAKKFAAKRAIDWLIANERMPANGQVAFPKPAIPPPTAAARPAGVPYVTQVPPLALSLGFNAPAYTITPVVPGAPLCDGYASFLNDPRVDGKVGEVKNVVGRKNAKEAVARLVVLFLQDIERQRMGGSPPAATASAGEDSEGDEAGAEDDKKRKRSSVDSSDDTDKDIKV